MTTSATACMRCRSPSTPATHCISASRCISRRMASATTEPMPSSSGTAAISRIGIGCLRSAISGVASSMLPALESGMGSPGGPPFRRSTIPRSTTRRSGSESAATRSPSRRSWGRARIRSRLRRACSAARGRKAGGATSITSRMYPSTMSTVCSPPGTRCTKNSGTLRRAQPVAIQIFHHPGHAANLGRMVASVRASLDHYTRQFGPYPYSYIRLIENPVRGMGVATEAATIEYGEGFSLLNPGNGPQELDIVFAVVAHGVARGWWGMQVVPADVEGAGLLARKPRNVLRNAGGRGDSRARASAPIPGLHAGRNRSATRPCGAATASGHRHVLLLPQGSLCVVCDAPVRR